MYGEYRIAGGDRGGAEIEEIEEREFSVVAVLLFGEKEVARFPTREQAEWRVRELEEEFERQPRGYVSYVVRPTSTEKRPRRPDDA